MVEIEGPTNLSQSIFLYKVPLILTHSESCLFRRTLALSTLILLARPFCYGDKISDNKVDNIYIKKLNKTNGQTWCLEVKNVTYFETERADDLVHDATSYTESMSVTILRRLLHWVQMVCYAKLTATSSSSKFPPFTVSC